MRYVLTGFLAAVVACGGAAAGGEIYGTVTTIGGERLTGPIRWDRNENFWDDLLDAERARGEDEERDEGFRLSLFGWNIVRIGGDSSYNRAKLSVPFGDIRSIESTWDGGGRITLKSGDVVEALASSDLGESMRLILVDVRDRGRVELEWDDVERVDFAPGPGAGRDPERLYGEVRTEGETFLGFVVWDRDESLQEDVLDGDADGKRRELRFAEIERIDKVDRRSARVRLRDGSELVLDGTNDVDSGNRGISVTMPGTGRVEVGWREFVGVTFRPAPESRPYGSFDGGRRLHGTVTDVDGSSVRGRIVWDRDERYTWEALDGEADGADYAVQLSNVAAVRPVSRDAAEIELTDGRKLVLSGTHDVGYRNRGVVVTTSEGHVYEYGWEDLRSVTFDEP